MLRMTRACRQQEQKGKINHLGVVKGGEEEYTPYDVYYKIEEIYLMLVHIKQK